jgi:hypothetical protein
MRILEQSCNSVEDVNRHEMDASGTTTLVPKQTQHHENWEREIKTDKRRNVHTEKIQL